METLSEAGYSEDQLEELRKLVHGEESDLFDVLSYVAFHSDLVARIERKSYAKAHLNSYNSEQQEFLNFVLDQYVMKGVGELSDDKLKPLIELKYNTIADAKKRVTETKKTSSKNASTTTSKGKREEEPVTAKKVAKRAKKSSGGGGGGGSATANRAARVTRNVIKSAYFLFR